MVPKGVPKPVPQTVPQKVSTFKTDHGPQASSQVGPKLKRVQDGNKDDTEATPTMAIGQSPKS